MTSGAFVSLLPSAISFMVHKHQLGRAIGLSGSIVRTLLPIASILLTISPDVYWSLGWEPYGRTDLDCQWRIQSRGGLLRYVVPFNIVRFVIDSVLIGGGILVSCGLFALSRRYALGRWRGKY